MSSADISQRPMKGFQMQTSSGSPAQLKSPGSGKVSLSLGGRKPAPPTTHGKRPHSMLGDHDGDEETSNQIEIVQFGGPEPDQKRPLNAKTIEPQRNRNWQQEAKRKRQTSSLPGAEHNRQGAESTRDVVDGGTVQYGLIIAQPADAPATADGEQADEKVLAPEAHVSAPPKTDDERAMDALLGKTSTSTAIITPLAPPATEDDAFRTSYHDAPPMASLEAYAAMPVEEFGAALLRGQGWKEGEAIGRQRHKSAIQKDRVVARRPALLGIGAKESGMGVELGAWGKGAKPGPGSGGRPRLQETSYNPVALRNRKTGELVTEDELKQKLEDQRNTDRSLKDASTSSKKDSDRDRDTSRSDKRERVHDYSTSDRDESRAYKRDGHRERDRDRDYDAERRRDKDRRRDDEKYRSSRRDRSRSRDSRDRRRRYEREDDYNNDYREGKDKSRRRHDDRKERDDSGLSRSKHRVGDHERPRDHDRRR